MWEKFKQDAFFLCVAFLAFVQRRKLFQNFTLFGEPSHIIEPFTSFFLRSRHFKAEARHCALWLPRWHRHSWYFVLKGRHILLGLTFSANMAAHFFESFVDLFGKIVWHIKHLVDPLMCYVTWSWSEVSWHLACVSACFKIFLNTNRLRIFFEYSQPILAPLCTFQVWKAIPFKRECSLMLVLKVSLPVIMLSLTTKSAYSCFVSNFLGVFHAKILPANN